MNAKKRILKAAYDLFCEVGYKKTSVQAIVDRSGTSKGGFYHHFKTKEDVVEAIVVGFVNTLANKFTDLSANKTKSVYELMNHVIKQVNEYKISMTDQWPGITKMLSFDGNTIIIQSMAIQFEHVMANAYLSLIVRGIDEGLFESAYPKQLAKLFAQQILQIYSSLTQIIVHDDDCLYQEFLHTLDFTQELINNNLGLKEHKIFIKQEALSYLEQIRSNMNQLKGVSK